MEFEQVVTLFTFVGGGVAAIWALVAKVLIPFFLKDREDRREFSQQQDSLERAYHLSEMAVRDQIIVELLADNTEFIRERLAQRLDDIESHTRDISHLAKDMNLIKYEFRDIKQKMSYLIELVTGEQDAKKPAANDDPDPT